MVPCNGPKNQNRVHLCILAKGIADAYSDTLHTVVRTRWHSAPIAARTQCPAPVLGAAELSLRQSREPRQCHEWAEEVASPERLS